MGEEMINHEDHRQRHVASRDNATFKNIKGLVNDAREVRSRKRAVIDGPHLLTACLDAGCRPECVVVRESALSSPEIQGLVQRSRAAEQVVFADGLFKELGGLVSPAGILAVIGVPTAGPVTPSSDGVFMDGIQDAGNVGSILRSAAAGGIRSAFLGTGCAGVWTPKVLRAAQGAHFRMNLAERIQPADLFPGRAGLVVATVARGGVAPWDLDLRQPVLWIFGSEGGGVNAECIGLASAQVTLPMAEGTESLNVAAAAAVCFFETTRQRRHR